MGPFAVRRHLVPAPHPARATQPILDAPFPYSTQVENRAGVACDRTFRRAEVELVMTGGAQKGERHL